ncbi:MAG TPA: DNA-binding response regulator, partial [bacterium]
NGLEFLENLRWDPRFEQVPVIVLTAMTLSEEEREFVEAFSVACLDKAKTAEVVTYLQRLLPDA